MTVELDRVTAARGLPENTIEGCRLDGDIGTDPPKDRNLAYIERAAAHGLPAAEGLADAVQVADQTIEAGGVLARRPEFAPAAMAQQAPDGRRQQRGHRQRIGADGFDLRRTEHSGDCNG